MTALLVVTSPNEPLPYLTTVPDQVAAAAEGFCPFAHVSPVKLETINLEGSSGSWLYCRPARSAMRFAFREMELVAGFEAEVGS